MDISMLIRMIEEMVVGREFVKIVFIGIKTVIRTNGEELEFKGE